MRRIFFLIPFLVFCGKGINYAGKFPYGKGYVLTNQNGERIEVDKFKGKVLVVGYIYTHCPDVCPLITENMKKIYSNLSSNGLLNNVMFLSITFDPGRDKPSTLKEYMKIYGIDTTSRWMFLTGGEKTIDSLMKDLSIIVQRGPVDVSEEGDTTYFIVHTDRIHVVGKDGKIVDYFKGSEAKVEDVVKAIRRAL